MYKILKKEQLTPLIYYFEIEAPRLAKAAKPGQFLIVRCCENGERVPLTICDILPEKEAVSIVVQIVGVTTNKLCGLKEGDFLSDVLGPLGKPADFVEQPVTEVARKSFLFIAGGVGTAPICPEVKYLHSIGAKVDIILGARNKELIILEDKLKPLCDKMFICTDDGSRGLKGNVTAMMEKLMTEGVKYDKAIAIGPMVMMKFATLTAKKYNLPIEVSINTLMVDGTGMCGACRLTVGGATKFACVDGPEFNGYEVDFDEALRRQKQYFAEEQEDIKRAGLDFLIKK